LAADWPWRNIALLHQHGRRCAARNRHGLPDFFCGNSTYPKTQNLRDVAKALPLENILIETDAPYLAPQPYRGKRNEPAYVAEVARTLATVRDLTPEQIAAATTENFRRFFGLAQQASLAASGLKADE